MIKSIVEKTLSFVRGDDKAVAAPVFDIKAKLANKESAWAFAAEMNEIHYSHMGSARGNQARKLCEIARATANGFSIVEDKQRAALARSASKQAANEAVAASLARRIEATASLKLATDKEATLRTRLNELERSRQELVSSIPADGIDPHKAKLEAAIARGDQAEEEAIAAEITKLGEVVLQARAKIDPQLATMDLRIDATRRQLAGACADLEAAQAEVQSAESYVVHANLKACDIACDEAAQAYVDALAASCACRFGLSITEYPLPLEKVHVWASSMDHLGGAFGGTDGLMAGHAIEQMSAAMQTFDAGSVRNVDPLALPGNEAVAPAVEQSSGTPTLTGSDLPPGVSEAEVEAQLAQMRRMHKN